MPPYLSHFSPSPLSTPILRYCPLSTQLPSVSYSFINFATCNPFSLLESMKIILKENLNYFTTSLALLPLIYKTFLPSSDLNPYFGHLGPVWCVSYLLARPFDHQPPITLCLQDSMSFFIIFSASGLHKLVTSTCIMTPLFLTHPFLSVFLFIIEMSCIKIWNFLREAFINSPRQIFNLKHFWNMQSSCMFFE